MFPDFWEDLKIRSPIGVLGTHWAIYWGYTGVSIGVIGTHWGMYWGYTEVYIGGVYK